MHELPMSKAVQLKPAFMQPIFGTSQHDVLLQGILALLNIETGVEITEIEAGLTFLLLLLFTEDLQDRKPPMQD